MDSHIEAMDVPTKGSARRILLNFCKGRLVQVPKYLQPRFNYFVRLSYKKRKELDPPLDAWSRPTDVTFSRESDAIVLIWRDGSVFLTIA